MLFWLSFLLQNIFYKPGGSGKIVYFHPDRKNNFVPALTLLPPLWEQSKNDTPWDELYVMQLYLLLLKRSTVSSGW